jgi:hypothetical protein
MRTSGRAADQVQQHKTGEGFTSTSQAARRSHLLPLSTEHKFRVSVEPPQTSVRLDAVKTADVVPQCRQGTSSSVPSKRQPVRRACRGARPLRRSLLLVVPSGELRARRSRRVMASVADGRPMLGKRVGLS